MSTADRLGQMHPMYFIKRPLADTHAIERVATAMITAIEQNSHGMRLEGNTQRGKTNALLHLGATAEWRPYPMAF